MKHLKPLLLLLYLIVGSGSALWCLSNPIPSNEIYRSPQVAATFTPVIDGQFNGSEHWELAENIHASFLQTDLEHREDYNYVYSSRTPASLYVLVDLCSDNSSAAVQGDWIGLWLDTDNSKTLNPFITYNRSLAGGSEYGLWQELDETIAGVVEGAGGIRDSWYSYVMNNHSTPGGGLKGIFYNLTTSTHSINLTFWNGSIIMNSSANFTFAAGFNTSPNSPLTHWIYEFNISLADLGMSSTNDYGLLVQGHGSMTAWDVEDQVNSTGFYTLGIGSAALYSAQLLSWWGGISLNSYVETGLFPNNQTTALSIIITASMERYFLPCGSSAAVRDLHDNPRIFTKTSAVTPSFAPTIDGKFDADEFWELGENIHACYAQVDKDHEDNYNYIYTSRQGGYLYVLVDLCSKNTSNPQDGEWISLWLTKNDPRYQLLPNYNHSSGPLVWGAVDLAEEMARNLNRTFGGDYYPLHWNEQLEGIFYNVSNGETHLHFNFPNGTTQLDSTATFTIQYGFGPSPNYAGNHRIYEFRITLPDLIIGAAEDYRLLVQGYGTLSAPTFAKNVTAPGSYALSPTAGASYLTNIISHLYEIPQRGWDTTNLTLPNANTTGYTVLFFGMLPKFYLPCGSSAAIRDLKDNPQLYAVEALPPQDGNLPLVIVVFLVVEYAGFAVLFGGFIYKEILVPYLKRKRERSSR